jgi:hypothetical protein
MRNALLVNGERLRRCKQWNSTARPAHRELVLTGYFSVTSWLWSVPARWNSPQLGMGRPGQCLQQPRLRHNFAIWAVKNNADTGAQRHLYYCLRCKQAFSVDDRSGCVTAVDSEGNTLQGSEAIRRLDTFSRGPCPAFSRLMGPRFTSKIIPIHSAHRRLTDLTSAGRRAWKAFMAQWHRLPTTDRTSPNVRSKRK